MGTKKILFFACLWLVTIGNARVIRGYDYCHDTLAEKINIRKVARYQKIWEKYYRKEVTEKQQRKIDRRYRKIKKYFSIKEDFEEKNYIIFDPDYEGKVVMSVFFGAGDSSLRKLLLRTERYYDKKGHLLESEFYLDGCEIGPFRTFNSEGKLIKTTSTDDHYFISIEQVRDIILQALEVDIFKIQSDCFLSKIREGGKYVYFLEFETRSEKGPRCAYYIDAYDGKILFKDVYYDSDKKLNDSFDPDFPKEKILVPVRDSLSLDDTY